MSSKISVQVVICLKNLQSLVSDLSDDNNKIGPTSQIWNDILARFRIWSSNIGAHQKGQSSLDYRLRDASHIRDQILKVLASLRQSLLDAEEILAEAAQAEENEDPTLELEEVYSSIQRLLECLFQLSMRIRRPALRDKVLGRRKDDSKDFEDFDRRHVKDKFPHASDVIVDRLTMAISKRRSNLKYFERHHRKLGKGISVTDSSGGNEMKTSYSSTLATTFHEASMDDIGKASISHASETSYAPSLFSSDSRITIPAPPLESAGGKPFECPFCYVIIIVSNLRDWAKHVFQDIEPYVCVVEDCNLPERLYKSRHEWMSHLRNSHQQSLDSPQCALCTEKSLTTLQLQQHLRWHLEDLALFILPATDQGPQAPDSENMDSDSYQQESNSDIRLKESTSQEPDVEIETYQEGDNLVIEDWEGNVIGTINTSHMTEEQRFEAIRKVQNRVHEEVSDQYKKHSNETHTKDQGEEIADEGETTNLSKKTFMNRFDQWKGFGRKKEVEVNSGRLSKQPEKKRGPAHAYQFGNTVIVEDEDGEVIRTYTLPNRDDDYRTQQFRSGWRRMSTSVGLGQQAVGAGSDSSTNSADGEAGASKMESMGNKQVPDRGAPSMTPLGRGRRLSTQDFIRQLRQLDPPRKSQTIDESDASEELKEAFTGRETATEKRRRLAAVGYDDFSSSENEEPRSKQEAPPGLGRTYSDVVNLVNKRRKQEEETLKQPSKKVEKERYNPDLFARKPRRWGFSSSGRSKKP